MKKIGGEIGVLGDLGMHACHIPLRLGWQPERLFAQLQKGYPQRPDGMGGVAACDTWDNALLSCWSRIGEHDVPLRLEMKRMGSGRDKHLVHRSAGHRRRRTLQHQGTENLVAV